MISMKMASLFVSLIAVQTASAAPLTCDCTSSRYKYGRHLTLEPYRDTFALPDGKTCQSEASERYGKHLIEAQVYGAGSDVSIITKCANDPATPDDENGEDIEETP